QDFPSSRLGGVVVLAQSLGADAALKFFNSFGTVASFIGILLLVFFAAGRATGRFARPVPISVFLGPAVVLLLIGLVIPALRTFGLSLFNDDATRLVGADNYTWAFTSTSIQQGLFNTLLWIAVAPIVTTALGLTLALLVDRLRLQAVYKSLIFMPMAVSFV